MIEGSNEHGLGPDTDGGPNPDYRPPAPEAAKENGIGSQGVGAGPGPEVARSNHIADLNEKGEDRELSDPRKNNDVREEALRHHAAQTREGEQAHPVDLQHAVVFILGLITGGPA